MRKILRLLRGALGNALVWGVSWFGASFALLTALHLYTGFLPVSDPWLLILYMSASSGVSGFLTGGAFSAYLRFAYWGRSLLEIKVGSFAAGGALIAGLVATAFNVVGRAAAGIGVGVADLLIAGALPTVLGGLTAAATIRVAQHASRQVTGTATDQLDIEQREVLALLDEGTPRQQS